VKILNLYAGIGGNRKLWGNEHQITAVELNPQIAAIYQNFFPNDKVIVADAHRYLLEHFQDYDFIWSSPPCPTHSRTNYFLKGKGIFRFPDMALYQEIIFLREFFEGKWAVENVIAYYEPLIRPTTIGRHYIWSNFPFPDLALPNDSIGKMSGKNQKANRIPLLERNAVNAELGKHILDWAINPWEPNARLAV
jgi:DNA (cytosine-5)-methyltransferase 1